MAATAEQLAAALQELQNLSQSVARMTAYLGEVCQQNNVLTNQLNAVQQLARDKEIEHKARNDELRAQIAQARGSRDGVLIDTRQIGKPSAFKSERSEWPTFSFKFLNYIASVHPDIRAACDWARGQAAEITTTDDLALHMVGTSVESLGTMSSNMYTVLASLVEGEALDILKNVPDGRGFEAWRRLVKNFDPQSAGRRRN
eukprot:811980-Pyramimonas_sp.AAC.1